MKLYVAIIFYFENCSIVFQFVIKKLEVILVSDTFFPLEKLVNLLCVLSIPNTTIFSSTDLKDFRKPFNVITHDFQLWGMFLIYFVDYTFPLIPLFSSYKTAITQCWSSYTKFLFFYLLFLFFCVFILPSWIFSHFEHLTILLVFFKLTITFLTSKNKFWFYELILLYILFFTLDLLSYVLKLIFLRLIFFLSCVYFVKVSIFCWIGFIFFIKMNFLIYLIILLCSLYEWAIQIKFWGGVSLCEK